MKIITENKDYEIPADENILGMALLGKTTIMITTSKGMWRIEIASGECEKIVETDWKLPESAEEVLRS
jgi:hypothetical protein